MVKSSAKQIRRQLGWSNRCRLPIFMSVATDVRLKAWDEWQHSVTTVGVAI
ncbi:hypothetical protein OH492_18950 [Vibrio chagasii]|nr:hypothetical protein [Vibrio chagasii]